jgi:hypothetical protein
LKLAEYKTLLYNQEGILFQLYSFRYNACEPSQIVLKKSVCKIYQLKTENVGIQVKLKLHIVKVVAVERNHQLFPIIVLLVIKTPFT